MKKTLLTLPLLALILLFISGCLTCEKKEYTFKMTGKDSGTLTIKYINIMSSMDDSLDVSDEDFMSLINDYYTGTSIEDEYPGTTLVDKKLYKEDGVLCGEITLAFSDLSQVKLYQHKGKGAIMYPLNCGSLDSETFEGGNGEYGGENMPIVFWDPGNKSLDLSTYVTEVDETTLSLLDEYLEYKAGME
jgi:hypothetical protein